MLHPLKDNYENQAQKSPRIYLWISSGNTRDSEKKRLNKKILKDIKKKIEEEDAAFAKKSHLDALLQPDKIEGREQQTEDLLRYLLGYKKGHVVPLVSVYGRTGSGKSTAVRFVCENMDEISSCMVNLRTVNTSFGCANLILGSLGEPSLKSASGINSAISRIEQAIVSKLKKEQKNFLALVLDEFDVLFSNKKENPSDFVYKLFVIKDNLQKIGLMMTIICIANNALAQYDLDDRVKSRMGSSDIFFEPY